MKATFKRGGFTLLELLVVIALMGVVSTLGTKFFFEVTNASTSIRQRTDLDRQADRTFELMRHDFERIVSPRLAGVSVSGVKRNTTEERFWNQSLGDDTVSFAVLERVDLDDNLRCVQAKYYVDRADGQNILTREVNDFGHSEIVKVAAGQNVVSLFLEYLAEDGTWADAWDRPELPEALRVSLTLVNPDSLEQVTRKAVFPVRVN